MYFCYCNVFLNHGMYWILQEEILAGDHLRTKLKRIKFTELSYFTIHYNHILSLSHYIGSEKHLTFPLQSVNHHFFNLLHNSSTLSGIEFLSCSNLIIKKYTQYSCTAIQIKTVYLSPALTVRSTACQVNDLYQY